MGATTNIYFFMWNGDSIVRSLPCYRRWGEGKTSRYV